MIVGPIKMRVQQGMNGEIQSWKCALHLRKRACEPKTGECGVRIRMNTCCAEQEQGNVKSEKSEGHSSEYKQTLNSVHLVRRLKTPGCGGDMCGEHRKWGTTRKARIYALGFELPASDSIHLSEGQSAN